MILCPTCAREWSEKEYGKSYYCRPCMASRARVRRASNPEKYRSAWKTVSKEKRAAQMKRWADKNEPHLKLRRKISYIANRTKELALAAKYKAENKAILAALRAAYLKEHPESNRLARSMRRAAEKQAIPVWADREKMLAFYKEAIRLTKETGIVHHVDHIVPLQSPLVCGLHWEGNMQVIPAAANQSKKNRFWPDMAAA